MSDDFLGVDNIENDVIEEVAEEIVEVDSPESDLNASGEEGVVEDKEVVEDKPKAFKVKIDGVEAEVDEAELIKGYQLEQASRKRLEEASKQMKMLENAIKVGKDEPFELLNWLGVDVDTLVRNYVKDKVEESRLTPEQKELKALKKKEAEWNARKQAEENAIKERQDQQVFEQAANQLEDEIIEALGKNATNPTLVSQVANLMLVALNQNKKLTAKEAYARIQNDTQAMLQQALASDDTDAFINNLSKDAQAKLRKALAQRELKQSNVVKNSKDNSSNKKSGKQSNKFNDLFGGAHLL